MQVLVTLLTPVSEAAAAAAKRLTICLPSQNQHRGTNAKLAPEAHHPGDNKSKKSAEEADDVTEIFNTPKASKKKRKKRKKSHQSDTVSEDSDTEPKKKKKKVKAHRSSIGSDSELDAGELPKAKKTSRQPEKVSTEADTEISVAQPKKRGCPRKIVDDTPVAPKVWSMSMFVEIASPQKLHTGKTPRGDKFVNMPATMGGPFVFMRKMGWYKFLEEVAEIVDVNIEYLGLDGMTWGFQALQTFQHTDVRVFWEYFDGT